MKRMMLAIGFGVALCAHPVCAETPSDESIQLLRQTMGVDRQLAQVTDLLKKQFRQHIDNMVGTEFKNATPEQKRQMQAAVDDFVATMYPKIMSPEWREKIIAAWENQVKRHYTQSEVDAQNRFFSQPDGRSLLQKMPQFGVDYMNEIDTLSKQHASSVMYQDFVEIKRLLTRLRAIREK